MNQLRKIVDKLDGFFFGVIVLNAIVIYLQVSGYDWFWLALLDLLCTMIFIVEMAIKIRAWGWRKYWNSHWNRMDFLLVLLSTPSVLTPFLSDYALGEQLSVLLIFRLLRVLKFFRLMKIFPNFTEIMKGFAIAMRKTWAVLAAFALLILILALINCSLFRQVAPEYFGTPLTSFYSIFRLFTVEGWYDIPDAIAAQYGTMGLHLVRLYFSILLILGGIIGMSLINSIFVDAMVEDNNDDVKKSLQQMQKTLRDMERKLDAITKAEN